jgi:hydroxymethylglutaryl-CoA synthase
MEMDGAGAGGIAAWGTYLPAWRLQRGTIREVLGSGGGRGTRAVASYDEDTTTLAVEAGRRALRPGVGVGAGAVQDLFLSTPDPPYLDKTSATTVHAALGLGRGCGAYDFDGSSRSAIGTLLQALSGSAGGGAGGRTTMALLADLRTGLAGSAEERDSGDGAAAFVCAPEGAVAELVGRGAASDEFLDRWRVPGEADSHVWEERFGEELYVPLAREAFAAALKDAGLSEGDLDHAVVTGLHARAVKAATTGLGVRDGVVAPDLLATVGNLGAAHAGVALCDVLERAEPGQTIAVLSLADGADAFVLRTTPALVEAQRSRAEAGVPTVAAQVEAGRDDLSYATFLTWRGQMHREPPRRPDPERPGAPTVHRSEAWKYGFVASRCTACGFRHMPPTRACLQCHAIDQMQPERLADVPGTVATFTIDHLAFSLSPPVIGVIIDFDGGGRFRCELTDTRPDELSIGDRVSMTFRRVWTAQGVHNYFWKARPLRDGGTDGATDGD